MKPENLSELSDAQLISKFKNLKTDKIIDAFIIGITIGVFLYGAVKNGLGLSTLFPIIIGYLFVKNSANKKLLEQEIAKEMKLRNVDGKKN